MPYGGITIGEHWFGLWLIAWLHQAITWNNDDLWTIRLLGTNFSEILIKDQ